MDGVFRESEIVTLVMSIGVLVFFTAWRSRLKEIPSYKTFLLSFYLLTANWLFTVLEAVYWPDLLNLLEHACYAASTILLAVWLWQVLTRRREDMS